MTSGWTVGARWLEGLKSLYRPPGRWLVNARWLVASDRACPHAGHAQSVRYVFLSIEQVAGGGRWLGMPGGWSVGRSLAARWPLAIGRWTCTPLGTSTQGVATNMGLTLGSRAIRHCSHVFFSFRLMKQTHLETSFCWTWLSGRVSSSLFGKFPDGIRPAATCGPSRFPRTMRTINTFFMIIPMRFYDHNHRDEWSWKSWKFIMTNQWRIISRNRTVRFSQI